MLLQVYFCNHKWQMASSCFEIWTYSRGQMPKIPSSKGSPHAPGACFCVPILYTGAWQISAYRKSRENVHFCMWSTGQACPLFSHAVGDSLLLTLEAKRSREKHVRLDETLGRLESEGWNRRGPTTCQLCREAFSPFSGKKGKPILDMFTHTLWLVWTSTLLGMPCGCFWGTQRLLVELFHVCENPAFMF